MSNVIWWNSVIVAETLKTFQHRHAIFVISIWFYIDYVQKVVDTIDAKTIVANCTLQSMIGSLKALSILPRPKLFSFNCSEGAT